MLKGFKDKRGLRSKFGGRELGKECMIKEDITCNREQTEQDEDFDVMSENNPCPHQLGVSTFARQDTSVL